MEKKNSPSGKLVHLRDYEPVSDEILATLPEGLVRRQMVVPLGRVEGRLIVAAVLKDEGQVKPEGLQMVTHCPVELVWASEEEIQAFIETHYPDKNSALKPIVADIPEPSASVKTTAKIPAALEKLLANAVVNRATEILLEREGSKVRVRQRIRGVLVSDMRTLINLQDAFGLFDFLGKAGELKIENGMKWAESRLDFQSGEESYNCDFLLSETSDFGLLTVHLSKFGEKEFAPHAWGMGPQQARVMENFLSRSQGLILFCGADTDDLTANLHACAKFLATPEKHIIAVDRTRDNWFPGVEQMISKNDPEQFSKFLKRAFRHGPDVLVANALERKDHFEICLNEALKGRLVLARVFAQDAPDAMLQMLGMNVEPYLIGSGLLGIVAQRMLRLNCQKCQDKDVMPRERIKELGIPMAMQPAAFFRGAGCDSCYKTGFDRETNIFEVLEMSDELRNRLSSDMKSEAFRSAVKSNGMMTLRQVAIHKAINGQTSLTEVLRTTS